MDKLILKILQFLWFGVAPAVLAWSFMSYHKYSFFGIVVGSAMAIFLWLANLLGENK